MQQKETRTKLNLNEELVRHIRGQPKEVYTIALDKKKTNELLTSEKLFGEELYKYYQYELSSIHSKFSDNP